MDLGSGVCTSSLHHHGKAPILPTPSAGTNGTGRSTEGAVMTSNYASREEREANSTGNTENCFPGRGENIHNTWLPHTDLSSFSPWKVFI